MFILPIFPAPPFATVFSAIRWTSIALSVNLKAVGSYGVLTHQQIVAGDLHLRSSPHRDHGPRTKRISVRRHSTSRRRPPIRQSAFRVCSTSASIRASRLSAAINLRQRATAPIRLRRPPTQVRAVRGSMSIDKESRDFPEVNVHRPTTKMKLWMIARILMFLGVAAAAAVWISRDAASPTGGALGAPAQKE